LRHCSPSRTAAKNILTAIADDFFVGGSVQVDVCMGVLIAVALLWWPRVQTAESGVAVAAHQQLLELYLAHPFMQAYIQQMDASTWGGRPVVAGASQAREP
jgi:hypothetical protein